MKGQSSIEFLSLVSMSALLLAVLYGFVSAKQTQLIEVNEHRTAERIAEKASFQIEMALIQGEGYSRVFNIDRRIASSTYDVKIGDGVALVEYGDERVTEPSRYEGDWINVSTNSTSVFRVVNDGNVSIEPQ